LTTTIPSLVSTLLPAQQEYVKGDLYKNQPIEDPCLIFDSALNYKIEQIYPVGLDKISISGGSIIKIILDKNNNIDNSVIEKNINSLLSNSNYNFYINKIKESQLSGLPLITYSRNIFSAIFNEFSKSALRKKAGLPEVLISSYFDNNLLKNNLFGNTNIICDFTFIPQDILFKILKDITTDSIVGKDKADVFKSPLFIGITGKPFSDLIPVSEVGALTSAQLSEIVLELFPIFNISGDNILKSSNIPGGYFTFKDNELLLKMPDLSGKDSFGISDDIYNDKKIYFELRTDSLFRKEIDFAIPPNINVINDIPTDNPINDDLIIEISSNTQLEEAYLSIIDTSATAPIVKNINTYNSGIELFTLPNIINNTSIDGIVTNAYRNAWINKYLEYYESTPDFKINEAGFMVSLNVSSVNIPNTQDLLGEISRPEVCLLSDNESPRSIDDRRYFNSKLVQARTLFANARPKIYSEEVIPITWIRTKDIQRIGSGRFRITFPNQSLNKIKLKEKNIQFVLYARDSYYQFGRAKTIIDLKLPQPLINKVSPSGFISDRELSPFSNVDFFLTGENLSLTDKLIFQPKGQLGLGRITIDKSELSITNTAVSFKFNESWQTLLFTPDTIYEVFVENKFGLLSNKEEIYISIGDGNLLAKDLIFADLSRQEEIFFVNEKRKRKQIISEIPIIYDNPSVIRLKSKSGYFSGSYNLYAYIAVDKNNKSSLNNIDLDNKIKDIDNINIFGQNKSISVATSIQYKLNASTGNQNFRRVSNNIAELSLNANEYKDFNFYSFTKKKHNFYIIFTNKPIENIDSQNPAVEEYFVTQIGDSNSRAFITGPEILGVAISYDNKNYSTISLDKELYKKIYEDFETNTFEISIDLRPFENISKLAIIYTSDNDARKSANTEFFIGSKKINKNLVSSITQVEGTSNYIAIFKNIKNITQENAEIIVQKEYTKFKNKGISSNITKIETVSIDSNTFNLNKDRTSLTLSDSVPGKISQNKFLENNPVSNIFNSGVFKSTNIDSLSFTERINFASNIGLKSNIRLILANTSKFTLDKNILQINPDRFINADEIEIPASSNVSFGSFLVDSVTNPQRALIFLRLDISSANIVYINRPFIFSIKEAGGFIAQDIKNVKFVAGKIYEFEVQALNDSFVFAFNDKVFLKPRNVKRISDYRFSGSFILPEELAGSPCPEIYLSSSNENRNTNKLKFGESYILDLQNKMQSEIDGITKKKIPDLNKLKEIILDFPLRLPGGLKLDQASIPTDLINSFCDMSFHLTADLKIALNGFQILMTPVQIIFCIIDVICALLNPAKLARAVIRLFQCLYDLVLLLPINSVPVMFISLAVHFLKLLECVFDKVNYLVNAINQVIKALAISKRNSDISGTKSLEEVLNEYLLELRVSLSVIDPIVSIFSIFIQLLGLVFRFPCSITDVDSFFCLDGTMLSGLISSALRNEDSSFNLDNLIPVIQSYTDKTLEQSFLTNSSAPLVNPVNNDIIAQKSTSINFIDSMNVDEFLRSTFAGTPTQSGRINAKFSGSVTKTTKTGKSNIVNFVFNEKGKNGVFNNKKIINPENNLDSPISLFNIDNNQVKVSVGSSKNLYSLNDGYSFLSIENNEASVKPLELTFDVPETERDSDTGQEILTGTRKITRTFDNIPSLAIIDDDFNVYFVEKNGISIKNNKIDKIRAKIINERKAPKISFSKEEQEIDTDGNLIPDAEADVFEFSQIYLFDMRNVAEEIQSKCGFDFFNNDRLENDPEEIVDIIEESQGCAIDYINYINNLINKIRSDLQNGDVPSTIDVNELLSQNKKIEECIGENITNICTYVVNTLNTQFKILDDVNFTKNESLDISNIPTELLDGFDVEGPQLTGAREYADGIGDDAIIKANNFATIEIIPRDSYDNPVPGDLSNNIELEILSDTTTTAIIIDNNGTIFEKNGDAYIAKITASTRGVVRIKAKICSKTIQAVTYAELKDEFTDPNSADCVPKSDLASATGALGELTKIDRILTITFIDADKDSIIDNENVPNTNSQVFGTALEN